MRPDGAWLGTYELPGKFSPWPTRWRVYSVDRPEVIYNTEVPYTLDLKWSLSP